jgi:hypothetical protein
VATPYSFPSKLEQKARARNINLDSAHYDELLPLYYETLNEIYSELYNEDLDDLAINEGFVRAVAKDVRLIVKGFSSMALTGLLSIIDTSGHLEDAQVELNVAKSSFDDAEISDSFATIRGRATALKNFRRTLYNVIIYWPREWKERK